MAIAATSTITTMATVSRPMAALIQLKRRYRSTVSLDMLSVEAAVAWFGLKFSLGYNISPNQATYDVSSSAPATGWGRWP